MWELIRSRLFILSRNNVLKRSKSFNSHEWLKRKLKDPYTEKAKMEHYRCRSAFKLLEIDDRFKIIKPGQCVIDIGAAPGSWSQVLVVRTNSNGADKKMARGIVISIDKLWISPIEGAEILSHMDFTKEDTLNKIQEILKGRKPDLVLSDMAPNASGVKYLDRENMRTLAASVLMFALKNLSQGGCCLIKMWQGRHEDIANEMVKHFESMKIVKPQSSQKESAEIYLLARDFKGFKAIKL